MNDRVTRSGDSGAPRHTRSETARSSPPAPVLRAVPGPPETAVVREWIGEMQAALGMSSVARLVASHHQARENIQPPRTSLATLAREAEPVVTGWSRQALRLQTLDQLLRMYASAETSAASGIEGVIDEQLDAVAEAGDLARLRGLRDLAMHLGGNSRWLLQRIDARERAIDRGVGERFRFAVRNGEHIIEEYHEGRRLNRVTYPNQRGRAHYRAGDFIFVGEAPRRVLQRLFPELARPAASGISMLEYLIDQFTLDDSYKYGERILSVNANGDGGGGGWVELVAVLFFSPRDVVELERRRSPTRADLVEQYALFERGQRLQDIATLLQAAAEVVSLPIGGIASNLARRGGRRLATHAVRSVSRQAIRRLMNRSVRLASGHAGDATRAFVSTLAADLGRQHGQAQLRQRAGTDAGRLNVTLAIERAAAAGATTFVSGWVDTWTDRRIKRNVDAMFRVDPMVGVTLEHRVSRYLTQRIVRAASAGKINAAINIAVNVHTGMQSSDRGSTFEHVLNRELVDEGEDWVRGEIEALASASFDWDE
jgi:hypothetical protein